MLDIINGETKITLKTIGYNISLVYNIVLSLGVQALTSYAYVI
jgi:hypothetical protein